MVPVFRSRSGPIIIPVCAEAWSPAGRGMIPPESGGAPDWFPINHGNVNPLSGYQTSRITMTRHSVPWTPTVVQNASFLTISPNPVLWNE